VLGVIRPEHITAETKIVINPSESFVIGGPVSDAGLTGRKIIADTYGGWGGHGGGAFSGKDATKVDRSGAYQVRQIAKSLVANGYCKRCVVLVSYGIGMAHPIELTVDTFGTVKEGFNDQQLVELVLANFDLRPGVIIQQLDLTRPIFSEICVYNHFMPSAHATWERVVKF
jgi:S-adenosylmethionine synthetase